MKAVSNLVLLILVALNLTSCLVTDFSKTLSIEIMKPGIINFPENANTIALVNRCFYINDTIPFKYFNGRGIVADTNTKYKALSDTCVNALAGFLKEDGYFRKVINYQDSIASLFPLTPEKMFQKTKSDIFIYLDFFNFNVVALYGLGDVTSNMAALSWTIAIKNDSMSYIYNQMDTLNYDPFVSPVITSDQMKIKMLADNSSKYLGTIMGTKIIPYWTPVERIYYKSNNQNMLLAEKYALENNWLKAAEFWNAQTKNKNPKIAAKASYNMALACEMEGKPDVAIDWLILSFESLKQNGEAHKANCQLYIKVLALRKKELEKLEKQIRNN